MPNYFAYSSNSVLLSVISPVHNGERYLVDFLNSVKNQSFSRFELLMVDDGSNDSSVSVNIEMPCNCDCT